MGLLYPLKFKPIFKDKIWGGDKTNSHLGLDYSPLANCGEVWALSGVKGNPSIVKSGFLAGNELNELVEIYMDDLVGERVFKKFGKEFPILIKFIDANDDLSIQVHPDDVLAKRRKVGMGKSEMWYIMQADEGAELISGFNRKTDKETYLKYLKSETLKDILNVEKVKAGDVFYIPAGRVHALGPGVLLAEIQQTSDITYRIFDWGRVDSEGKSRELHTELALEAIDLNVYKNYKTNYTKKLNITATLLDSPYFTTNLIYFSKAIRKDYSERDSFIIYVCIEGAFELQYSGGKMGIKMGETVLIPAMMEDIIINPKPETKILEVFIKD